VQRRRQHAGRARQAQVFLQALGQPRAARGNASEPRRGRHERAHPVQQFAVEGLGVEHEAACGGRRGGTHGRLLKNCSRMMQAAPASASGVRASASAAVVL
jgi:hypothetical protein